MANNPFYPGYSPKKEGGGTVNPLYPGYYTGKPITKRPGPIPLQPVEFDFDAIGEQLDAVANTVENMPLGPKWVKDRIADDWKNQLKVSVNPSSKLDVTELDDFATDDFAGAVTTLSLNPKDWGIGHKDGFEQTKKQAIKTLSSWLRESTGIDPSIRKYDASEINNKASAEMFLMAMGYKNEDELLGRKPTVTQKIGADTMAERTTAQFFDLQKLDKPLDIKGISAKEYQLDDENNKREVNHTDLYRETAQAANEFVRSRDSYKDRDKSHTEFLSKALNAANIEIMDQYRRNSDNEAVKNHSGAIQFFDIRVQTMKALDGFHDSIKGQTKTLQKIVLGQEKKADVETLLNTSKEQITKTKTKIISLEMEAKKLLDGGEIDEKSYKKYLGHTQKSIEHLGNLEKNIENYTESGRGSLGNLVKNLRGTTPDKSFVQRTTFQESLGGGLKRDLEASLVSQNKDEIGSLLNDRDVEAAGVKLAAKKIAPIATRFRQDRIKFATKEILDSFDKGGIPGMTETYVWKRIKNELPEKLRWFSSGEVLGDALKKNNYFGLNVTEEGTPSESNLKKYARFEKKFGYKVDVDLDTDISQTLGTSKLTVWGKDTFFKGKRVEEDGGLNILKSTNKYFSLKSNNPDIRKADRELFSKLLNNDRSDETLEKLTKKMFNKTLSEMQKEDTDDLNKFLKRFENAGEWINSKTDGKIKVLDKQTGGFLILNSAVFGIGELKVSDANYPILFKNNKINLFLKDGIDAKVRDQQVQQIKRLLSLEGEKNFREASLNKIVRLATGKDFLALSESEQNEWLAFAKEFKDFSEWVKSQRSVFGDKVDEGNFRYELFLQFKNQKLKVKPVDVDESNAAFRLFQNIHDKNSKLNDGYRLTDNRKFIGRLEKINNKMQSLQKAWQKTFIGKVVKFAGSWKEIASEKIVALLSKALAKMLGIAAATTGILALIMPVLQAIAEKAIKKGLDYATASLKAVFKLDFSELDKMLQKDFEKVVHGCLIVWIGITVIIILPILLFFGTLTSVISPVDTSREGQGGMYEGYEEPNYAGRPLRGVFAMDFYHNEYPYEPTGTDPEVGIIQLEQNLAILKALASISCNQDFSDGVEVKKGDVIATMGDSGREGGCSTGAHLHFEIQVNCKVVDPNTYLEPAYLKIGESDTQVYKDFGTVGGEWSWPMNKPIRVTQEYGITDFTLTYGWYDFHSGLDMVNDNEQYEILAPEDGILIQRIAQCGGADMNFAAIDHGEGVLSFYLHVEHIPLQ